MRTFMIAAIVAGLAVPAHAQMDTARVVASSAKKATSKQPLNSSKRRMKKTHTRTRSRKFPISRSSKKTHGETCASDHRPGLAIKPASSRLLLPVGRARNVGHRQAVVDGLAADRFGLRLLLGRVEHFEHDVARNEADAGVVGNH